MAEELFADLIVILVELISLNHAGIVLVWNNTFIIWCNLSWIVLILLRHVIMWCYAYFKLFHFVPCSITDAMNETKDKVRYLESLKRHLDMLYNGATPANIISVALPGLLAAVKQMDSVSRFYSRQGFLGLLFTKVGHKQDVCYFVVSKLTSFGVF